MFLFGNGNVAALERRLSLVSLNLSDLARWRLNENRLVWRMEKCLSAEECRGKLGLF